MNSSNNSYFCNIILTPHRDEFPWKRKMSKLSNNHGRAYEFACLNALRDAIARVRSVEIFKNSSFEAAENAWNTLCESDRTLYTLSALSTIDTIFALEPNIMERNGEDDVLTLYIQPDKRGETADVRDIIIERKDIVWEIGLSIKHNHQAVKHSRIAKNLDFGSKWYGIPCSETYWKEIKPVFDVLEREKTKGTLFKDLVGKEEKVYVPLLNAFAKEITTQVRKRPEIPQKLIEYLLSRYDFYKVVSTDEKRLTTIQSFNMYGTLNLPGKYSKPTLKVPHIQCPKHLLHIGFKPNSKTSLLLCLDNGWQFSFRLHNAEKQVNTSLKFDIQIVGMPAEINIKFNCKW